MERLLEIDPGNAPRGWLWSWIAARWLPVLLWIATGLVSLTYARGAAAQVDFELMRVMSDPSSLDLVATGDFDGDGRLDTAYSLEGGAVLLRRNDGAEDFTDLGVFSFGDEIAELRAIDLDRDGHVDLVAGLESGSIEVRYAEGAGAFGAPFRFDAGASLLDLEIDDANEDGLLDFVVATWSGIVVCFGLGPREYATPVPRQVGFVCFSPVSGPGYIPPLHVANTLAPSHPRLKPPGPFATDRDLPGAVLEIPGGTFNVGDVLTFQGMVGDGNTSGYKVSVTNAVVVHIE